MSFHHRVLPHAHPHSLRHVDMPVHFMHTLLRCERKLEHLEKTQANVGRLYNLHRQWPWPGIFFFFLLSYQRFKEIIFIEMMLFDYLLCDFHVFKDYGTCSFLQDIYRVMTFIGPSPPRSFDILLDVLLEVPKIAILYII